LALASVGFAVLGGWAVLFRSGWLALPAVLMAVVLFRA
jgi:hypothetical protein